ncbi:hypothetical protein KAR91_48905 [Candidatus Pacearchaeota archaeon]|nr:hypothetical protein [Candidatus Pacearchaeota archaeon]
MPEKKEQKEQEELLKEIINLVRLVKRMALKLYLHNPEEDIFTDGTLAPDTLTTVKKEAELLARALAMTDKTIPGWQISESDVIGGGYVSTKNESSKGEPLGPYSFIPNNLPEVFRCDKCGHVGTLQMSIKHRCGK